MRIHSDSFWVKQMRRRGWCQVRWWLHRQVMCFIYSGRKVQDCMGALTLPVRVHLWWHWRSPVWPGSLVLIFGGGSMAILGFSPQACPCLADGLGTILTAQSWAWRGSAGGLTFILMPQSLPLCVDAVPCCPWKGWSTGISGLPPLPSPRLSRDSGCLWLLPGSPVLTTL